MSHVLIFDTSSIISIVTNNLCDVLKELKKRTDSKFLITQGVKEELIDAPLNIRKYKLEAMQVMKLIDEGVFEIISVENVTHLLCIVNNMFYVRGKPLILLQKAELEGLILYNSMKANAYVVDERTLRLFVEDIRGMKELLQNKLHKSVDFNSNNYERFKKEFNGLNILRSSELMVVAYEKGLFNNLISDRYKKDDQVDALLWGLRLRGCAISTEEIDMLKNMVKKH